MNKLSISLIAFPEAPMDIIKRGENLLKTKLADIDFEINEKNPDAIFVITGGSENQAKKIVAKSKRILILAMTESNSYAAATEIKAYCNQNGIDSVLYNIDNEVNISNKIDSYIKCTEALNNLANYKIGLIGNVSEWLISSDINKDLLHDKFGIHLEKIAWSDYPEFSNYNLNEEFLNHFNQSNGFELEDSSRVYELLQDIIHKKQLDAITVECFPLVRENAVTACLALSQFNTNGTAAGCEGDITSIVGKVISKELTGHIPWMANLAAIENNQVFFAHCTIATNLVSSFEINTHFETNQGTAVQGQFKHEDATIFRLNNELTKAFVSFGSISEKPNREDSCRTQIKINIPENDIQKLKDKPLGNHHLVLPGDHRELLEFFLKMIKVELV